jgi:hypothetical protein
LKKTNQACPFGSNERTQTEPAAFEKANPTAPVASNERTHGFLAGLCSPPVCKIGEGASPDFSEARAASAIGRIEGEVVEKEENIDLTKR